MALAEMSEPVQQLRLEQIRGIWADVLMLDPEDIEDGDNFFECMEHLSSPKTHPVVGTKYTDQRHIFNSGR